MATVSTPLNPQDSKMRPPSLCVILPCYNEEEILPYTISVMKNLLSKLIRQKQINENSRLCFVDDGSTDNSWRIISDACNKDPLCTGLKLSRNFGHQGAILAGINDCNSDLVVTLDADLQDDPACIVEMLKKAAEGCEIVYGVRARRDRDSWFKRTSALLFYRLMRLLGCNLIYNHADYRLMTRKAVLTLRRFPERNLFLRAIMPLLGFKTAQVFYDRVPRRAGTTKYPLVKMVALAWNGISSFSIVPLRFVTFLGLMICMLSIFFLIFLFIRWSSGGTIVGWASLVTIITVFSGVQLLSIGIIGEYLAKIFVEVKERPLYIIDEKIGIK